MHVPESINKYIERGTNRLTKNNQLKFRMLILNAPEEINSLL